MLFVPDKPAKRLCIYFFYDKDGMVDDYVFYFLKSLQKHLSNLLVVCNGKLTAEARNKLTSMENTDVIVRENKGFDVWAYKTGLMYYGWDKLSMFDEVIMANFTIMGPVNTFDEMFDDMDKRDLDFWGLTVHNGVPYDPWGKLPDGYIPRHIQSHFIAVRNSMLRSFEFKEYWDNIPEIKSYEDAICLHEAIFTQTFETVGYKWDSYIDTDNYLSKVDYPLFDLPVDLLKNFKCPVFKRKSFFYHIGSYLANSSNERARALLDYLKNETTYNLDLIIPHLLRICDLYDVETTLNLKYILPTNQLLDQSVNLDNLITAIVLFIRDMSCLDYCFDFSNSIPEESDLYIITTSAENADRISAKFDSGHSRKMEIKVISDYDKPMLINCKDIIDKYEYVCYLDVTDIDYTNPKTIGMSYSDECYKSMLCSKAYVKNVISTFCSNPHLGVLVPPKAIHASYYSNGRYEWQDKYKSIISILKDMKIKVITDINKHPFVAQGNCLWFRPAALTPLFEYDWSDYHAEDPSFSSSLDISSYLYPFVAQKQCFYTAQVMPESVASNSLTNQEFYLSIINSMISNTLYDFDSIRNVLSKYTNNYFISHCYWNDGNGYSENNKTSYMTMNSTDSSKSTIFNITIPFDSTDFRFDPIEGQYCIYKNLTAICHEKDLDCYSPHSLVFECYTLLASEDPQIVVKGNFKKSDEVTLIFDDLGVLSVSADVLNTFIDVNKSVQNKIYQLNMSCENSQNMINLLSYDKQLLVEELQKNALLMNSLRYNFNNFFHLLARRVKRNLKRK